VGPPQDLDLTEVGPPQDLDLTEVGPPQDIDLTEVGPPQDFDLTEVGPTQDLDLTELGPPQDLDLTEVGPPQDPLPHGTTQHRTTLYFVQVPWVFEPTMSWPDGSQAVHALNRDCTIVSRFKHC
jgi:hypothetical protein